MANLSRSDLAAVLAAKTLAQEDEARSLAGSIAAYLLEEHRVAELDSLVRDVQKCWAERGYVDLLARVARPLPKEVLNAMADRFSGSYPKARINVSTVVDPAVIGGASIEFADQRLDVTISRRLARFSKRINAKKEVNV